MPLPVAFLLVPQFSMMSFASAVEPLRSANRMSGRTLYSWQILSPDGAPVSASNGIAIVPAGGIAEAARSAMLVVCAGTGGHRFADAAVFGWLRRLDRQGLVIGGVSLGGYLLARAGLLAGYRCTVHWENLAAFAEEFPDLEVSNELFEIDRNRFTCSGGIAALDLMLDLIARQHGGELAKAVSEQFIQERIRDRHDRQRMALPARLGIRHPKLLAGWPPPSACRAASSSACSAAISIARRPATISSCGWRAPACCCCRPICRCSRWRWPAASSRPRTSPNAIARPTAARRATSGWPRPEDQPRRQSRSRPARRQRPAMAPAGS